MGGTEGELTAATTIPTHRDGLRAPDLPSLHCRSLYLHLYSLGPCLADLYEP